MKVTLKGTFTQNFTLTLDDEDEILKEMAKTADCNGMSLEDVIDDYFEDGMLNDYIDAYGSNDWDSTLDDVEIEEEEDD